MKRTDWFDGELRPKRLGAYERNCTGVLCFSWWNGTAWGSISRTTREAYLRRNDKSSFQDVPWRGLTQPAEA